MISNGRFKPYHSIYITSNRRQGFDKNLYPQSAYGRKSYRI